MKFNVKNKTAIEIDSIIEMFATTEQAELMGFKFLLPLLDENETVLELKGYGEAPKKAPKNDEYLGCNLWKKSNKEIAFLNSFPA